MAQELAGTQVLVNGDPIPLFYVVSTQVNAQAPYRLDGTSNAEIQIIYEDEASNVVTVAVAPSAPGFFMLPEDRTQVIAILPDGSLNFELCRQSGPTRRYHRDVRNRRRTNHSSR